MGWKNRRQFYPQRRDLGGEVKLEILHPSSPSSAHLNDASIVAKVTYNQVNFLFTGDAEEASEQQILLQSRVQPTSTVLKVGHHGSNSSTSTAFLRAVDPDIAVIMVGEGNTYAHPHEETLQMLNAAGVDIYRTDINGDIVITTDGQSYNVNNSITRLDLSLLNSAGYFRACKWCLSVVLNRINTIIPIADMQRAWFRKSNMV